MSDEQIWIRPAWDPLRTGVPATFRRIPARGDTITLTRPELEGLLRKAGYELAVEAGDKETQ